MDNNNMLKLCRLCLVKDDVNIPIFEEQGDIRQIFLKISSCLPVKVSRDDQLPKKICDGCSYKLDMLYEFWNTSANAEKQLLTWLGEAGMSSQMADGTISAVAQQIKPADAFVKQETIDPPDIHMDDDDDDDEEDKDYMKQEDNSNNVEEPPPKRARRTAAVKAAIALDQNSDDDDDSGEPMTKVEDDSEDSDNEDHEPAFVDVPSTSADDQPGPSGVGKDGVEAPLMEAIDKYAKQISKRRFGNKDIQAQLSQEEYDLYLKKPIKLENPLICQICNSSYTNNIDFGFHSIKHKLLYECHICEGYSHQDEIVFEKHIREHEGVTRFQCPICEKPFQTLKGAHEHRLKHENKKSFECDLCQKQYYSSYLLKEHKKEEHYETLADQKEEQLYCKLCDKHYRNRSGMSYHNFRHHRNSTSRAPVLCEICGLDFPNRSKLKSHMNKHTVEKPFTCEYCSKTFTHSSTLNVHKSVKHTGTKRYTCSFCGKQFPFHAAYNYHLKLHTGEKPHGCLICEKKFVSLGNLRLHMKHFHKCTT
ncbi:zinc finger protein ZFMSA12A-like isoform X35 [Diorhabda carinulata]|uniref:zinc finger protein ZFMSA12A-like isoform X35 n=1 Tax=Diorhabda carinulata TaxID=1163345 RepID=UPI0025A14E3F|nr:zinc finger protein ZFMSA12A-like isoform X35 [Diorhabda carinulata]